MREHPLRSLHASDTSDDKDEIAGPHVDSSKKNTHVSLHKTSGNMQRHEVLMSLNGGLSCCISVSWACRKHGWVGSRALG